MLPRRVVRRGLSRCAALSRGFHENASGTGHAKKICVFGSGSFGTALGSVLARQGNHVVLLTRREEVSDHIKKHHRNPSYLSQYPLPYNLTATTDPEKAISKASAIVHCVPVQSSFEYMQDLKTILPADVPIINTSKGLHTNKLQLMTELIPEALGRDQPLVCASGPSFARELMEGWPTGLVFASTDEQLARESASLFSSQVVRTWTTTDVVGVQLGGALKNVYAIASGVLEGLGLGLNTTTLLVTRAVAETNRLATAMGSTEPTLVGLAGIGDLMLTAFGSLSRNRTVGVRLGRGETLAEIMETTNEAAEGVATTPAALAIARSHGIDVPIIEAVDALLKEETTPVDALLSLMGNAEDPQQVNPEKILS